MAKLAIKVTLEVGQSQIILIYTVEEINAANKVTCVIWSLLSSPKITLLERFH